MSLHSPNWWSYAWLPLKTVTPAFKETFIPFCQHKANFESQLKKWKVYCYGRSVPWRIFLLKRKAARVSWVSSQADLQCSGWQNTAQNYAYIIHVSFIFFKTAVCDFRRWWILPCAYITQTSVKINLESWSDISDHCVIINACFL